MRIAFDGTTLRPGRTGVGYYTEHLLEHLVECGGDDELVVISNRSIETTRPLPSTVRRIEGGRRLPRLVWMQTRVPQLLREIAADVVHFTNGMMPVVSTAPTVVTIHDMSLTLYPRYHPRRRVILNRPLVDLAARRANAIITVSESARKDIIRLYGVAPARVHVIHEAAAPAFQPITDPAVRARVRARYGLAERFILYVGTIEPRKNLPMLIEAFAERRRAGDLPHQLVCAGPYGWLCGDVARIIERLQLEGAVRVTGYVPFDDLPAIYSLAEMFVFPSVYEGFGLPVVEAMACGTPVVTADVSALAEVGGGAVAHVPSLDVDALGEELVSLARSRERREHLSALGLQRARTFSWRRAAQETLAVYRRIARNEHHAEAGVRPASVKGAADRVLIGQAYFLRFDPKLWDAQQPYPPLGALYAAAAARAAGFNVSFFDAMLSESEAAWGRMLDRHRPGVAVLYEDSFNYLTKMCLLRMREAAMRMIDACRARNVPVIVAGSDATDHPALYLARGARLVIAGEGEATLVDALKAVAHGGSQALHRVGGIVFLDQDNHSVQTPARAFIRDLDTLPRPAWDLIDLERYRRIWLRRHGYFSMNIATTRGCPYHCNWCAKPIYGQRYAARTPEAVIDEIEWLRDTYRPDHLWIADDIFGLKPQWIEQFAQLATARGVRVPFKCLLRADGVTPAAARALREAGCRTAWIGAESGSQRILDAMEKGTTVGQIAAATELLHAQGIEVGFFLQFGYPGECRQDIEQTLAMVRSCRPDDIGVSVSYPLPGTKFYERVRAQLGETQNWVHSDDLAMMYRATFAPDFYRTLHAVVHAEFRASRALDRLRGRPRGGSVSKAREVINGLVAAARLPLLRRRLERSARASIPAPTAAARAGLSSQTAVIRTEES
jgi:anaerobic magnesium-protoporphyrin IX monomethyl ester cyclase